MHPHTAPSSSASLMSSMPTTEASGKLRERRAATASPAKPTCSCSAMAASAAAARCAAAQTSPYMSVTDRNDCAHNGRCQAGHTHSCHENSCRNLCQGGGSSNIAVHVAKQLQTCQETAIPPSGLSTAATAAHCRALCEPVLLQCRAPDLPGCNAAALPRKGLCRS